MTLSVHRRAATAALLCALAVIVTMTAVAAANVAQDEPTPVTGSPLISVVGDTTAEAGRPYLLDVTIEGIDQSQVSEWTVSWGDGMSTKGTGSPGNLEHVYEHVGSAHQITVSVITSDGDILSNAALVLANYDTTGAPPLYDVSGQPASDQLVGDTPDNIAAVLVGPDRVLYAIDDVANTIVRFDLDRKTRLEAPLDRDSVIRQPRAMAFDAEGHLLVVDATSNAIHQLDVESGQIVRSIAGDGHLNRPSALIIGPHGDLYVTDAADDDIERFDFATGRHLGTFATFEPGAIPTSLVWGPDDALLVSLPGAGRIASVSSAGELANFGADVNTPDQLAVGPDGALWVSDYWNDTVSRFDLKSGGTLDGESILEGTAGPRGLSFAPDVSVTVIAPSDTPSSDPSPDELTAQEWRESLPEDQDIDELIFVANDGEAEPQLDFIAQSDDYIAVIADNTIEVALDQTESDQLVTIELEDATEKPPSGASTDTRVAFDDVYDGIDAVYSDDEGELEYSFIIEPGADVDDISLDFGGAETLQITEQGDLFIDVSEGSDLLSTAPFTFQFIDGRRVVIESSYVIRPDGTVGFGLGAYDPTRPVVIDPTLTAATNLLMMTGTGTATGTDAAKQTLFQSWGWTVTLIDDDSIGSFSAAASANDVLYVSGTARFDIAYDVRDLDIGIVNENFSAWNGLLNYGSQPQAFTTGATLNIVDNSHYITSPFATGSLAIHSVGDDINYWPSDTAPLPAGVTVLAEVPTSTNHEALHVAEAGTTLYSAFTAVNRRVWFPSDYADPANYTTDYETLLERSLDWAAGNDGVTSNAAHDYYLVSDGAPQASMITSAPVNPTLADYDGSGTAGRVINKDSAGLAQTDPTKYQLWVGPAGALELDGPASLSIWAAMKDFETTKRGVFTAGLFECASNGTDCNLLAQHTVDQTPLIATADWAEFSLDFGSVSASVPAGRSLGVKLVVDATSADSLWFAYDTTTYTAGLDITLAAGPMTVNSTADVVDQTPGNGSCDTGNTVGSDPECTLRAAIQESNSLGGEQTIVLPAGTYTRTISGTGEDASASGDFDINDTVTITTAGDGIVTLDADGIDRVFEVRSGTLTLSGVTVTGGSIGSVGGGLFIRSGATADVADALIAGNTGVGGGITTDGTLVMVDSLISANTSSGDGGGLHVRGSSGSANLTNVTISGNNASGTGGGIFNNDTVVLMNSTITNNTAGTTGGIDDNAATTLGNTIVAGNTGGSNPDADGTFTSSGNNLIGVDGTSSGWVGSDLLDTDPILSTLADNGGPTHTHAIGPGSPALDAGTATSAPTVDQRGTSRPIDGDGDTTATHDIGAFEYDPATDGGGGGNNPPTAVDDNATVIADRTTIIDVLGNDTDPDGDSLEVIDITSATNGSTTITPGGSVSYTPNASYTGADSFEYLITDSATNLTNYWSLDGDAFDGEGSNDGVLTGTTTVQGDFGDALSFNESSDRVTIPDVTYGSDFTLSFEFKLDDNTGSLFQYVYSHGDINSTNSVNVFFLEDSHGSDPNVLRTVIRDGDDTLDNAALQTSIASLVGDGQWHTYTVSADSSNGLTVWIDGVQVASDPTRGTGLVDPTGSVYLGTRQDLNADRWYGGSLDTVQLIDRGVSDFEVTNRESEPNRAVVNVTVVPCTDSDSDGLCDLDEDVNADADGDPSTNPGPDTDGDTTPNYLDADDDGDGLPTIGENADPNGDGDPRDAQDADHDGEPDYLDMEADVSSTPVAAEQKISNTSGDLTGPWGASDWAGTAVASIGDLDGDGITDIAVGANGDDDGGGNHGAVWVLFLNANGTVKAEQKISDTAGGFTDTLDSGDQFGSALTGPGDIDGDGIPDLVVGARLDDDGGSGRGAAYILFLNTDGTVRAEQKISDTQGGLATTLDTNDEFGHAVEGIGDLDGDGIPDIAVGAWGDDDGGSGRGAVYILFLNSDGTVRAEQKISDISGGLAASIPDGSNFGVGLGDIGDVDGDGITDLAVGAWNDTDGGSTRGAVYVLMLNADGTVAGEQKISATAGGFGGTLDASDDFGAGVSGIGDVDGDGTPDLAVGAPRDDDGGSSRGALWLLTLNTDGTVGTTSKISSTAGGFTGPLDDNDQFGYEVTSLGDLDDDGSLNLLVGAWGDGDGASAAGAVYVLDLSPPSSTVAVNSTGDLGDATPGDGSCDTGFLNSQTNTECTLRAAIEEANASAAIDTIHFDIPTSESGYAAAPLAFTITPGSVLPAITSSVVLDATTQSEYAGRPVIQLDGKDATGATAGILIHADDVTASGFIVHSFDDEGIEISNFSSSADRSTIINNWIGIDASEATRANLGDGVLVTSGSAANTIGSPGQGNVISGNVGAGVLIRGVDSDDNIVQANLIGVGSDGSTAVPNGSDGIQISDTTTGNRIGGTLATEANTIANNGGDGVAFLATAGFDNAVLRNEIHSNAGMGIDIDPNGVNANDPGDTDGPGPNDLLNYPSITSATTSGSIAILNGTYDVPAGSYRFDFYKNPSGADASGFGEGEQWVATSTLSHSGSGAEGWGAAFVGAVGDIITITVTEDLGGGNYGSTSEFSSAATVTAPAVVVNSTGDAADQTPGDGSCDTGGTNSQGATECTLRAAIEEANALPGGDTIEFNMPSTESGHTGGVWTLSPATVYPELTERVELDASSQPGFVGTPIVELDGSALSVSSEHGLQLGIGSDGSTIRGLSVISFPGAGLYLEGSDSHTVAGNYIGLAADGSTASGNRYGMYMSASSSTTIGGTTPADRNVISANTFSGVAVYNSIGLGLDSLDTVIIGNYIGTDSTGMLDRGNLRDGLFVVNGSSRTQVGGSNPGEGNLIAANTDAGVYVGSGSMVDTVVIGNTIGVSVDESLELPNEIGVEVGWSQRTIVQDNLIGSATSHGVVLSSANNAVVAGNTIGTDLAGSAAWTIGGHGVLLENTSDLNVIGGTLSSNANTITNAGLTGVAVPATAGANNSILRNEISANTGLGIDLDVDGVTPNSSSDSWMDYPDITSVVASGGTLTVQFNLDVPAGAYRIEFFNNLSGADPSGFGEGEAFVHATTATHTGSGTESFSVNFAGSFGDIITATATQDLGGGSFGSTSEFSGAVAVLPVAMVNSTGDLGDSTPGDDVCNTGGTNSEANAECTLRAAIEEANASADVNTIEFDIPATETGHLGGVWTIAPGSQLPDIAGTTTIDATTQTGWTSTPVVELNGTGAGAGSDGLRVAGDGSVIRGLAVNRFQGDGLKVLGGAANTVIESNHIGLDATGLVDRGNIGRGIDLQTGSGPTTVGGALPIQRNVISGNGDDGIIIFGSNDNVIIGNYIGTDVTGLASGPGIGNATDGIVLANGSANNTIGQAGSGNVLSGNGNDGLEIDDVTGPNTIQGNIMGLGFDGDTLVPNGRYGIVLYNGANNNQIGGGGPNEGNVISGNTTDGLYIDGNSNAATTANVIEGNYIGTDATGTLGRGNVRYGVRVDNAANSTIIGRPGAGNTISGNGQDGIYLSGAGTDNTVIQGNYVGTNAAGDAPIPNDDRGIQIESGASFTQIGGTAPGEENVISGNAGDGVIIADWLSLGTTGTVVEGNLIGVEADGSTPLGNGGHGVQVDPVTGNRIGGAATGAGNVIANNGSTGTQMAPTSGTNTILGNSIYNNVDVGLGLGWDGVTPNDAGDIDSGPNGLLNFPEITSASVSGGSVTVDFELDVPAGDYRIELFTNPSGSDPTGFGEGEIFETAVTVTHTGSGAEAFSTSFAGSLGDVITSTATEDFGGSHGATSEFSATETATATDAVVNSTADAGDSSVGDGVCDTGALNTAGVAECTLRAAIEESNAFGAPAIVFDIPTTEAGHDAGVWTISPSAPFDDLTAPVSMDASTQPGWSTTPVIQIDGSGTGAGADGFRLVAGSEGSEIRSLSIGSYASDAIEVQSNDVVVAGNHLGLDAAGTTATPMAAGAGVNISGAERTTIGGSNTVDRNVIAGGPNGIVVGSTSTDTVIIGNYVGTDVTGSATAAAFSQYSIYVLDGSANTRIGGPLTTDRNIIASRGIYIRDETTDTVLIENNSIGVGADGTSAVDVASRAILVSGGSDDIDVIDNVIGNAYRAVEINGATTNSQVRGNTIGTDSGLTTDHGTTVEAIEISGGAAGIQIGGTTPAEANRIQFVGVGFPAITVADAATDDVHVLGNSILHDHGAIDLGADGPTPNDSGDTDGGANDLLNFPTLTVTNTTGSGPFTVDLDVTLDTAAGDHRIEIYSNADPGYGGLGKGEVLQHAFTFTHTGSGPETVSTTYVGSSFTGLSATATEEFGGGAYGSTSEMSPIATITADAVVNSTGDLGDADLNDGQCDTGGTNSDGATECTFRAAIEQTNRAVASRVDFAIPTTDSGYDVGGYWTINQASDYEDIFASTTVDGSTQPGWDGSRPVVFVNDNGAGSDLVTVFADDVTVRSLAFGKPGDDALQIQGDRATLDDLWIGLDPAGNGVGSPGDSNEGIIVYDGANEFMITNSRITGFDGGVVSNSGTLDGAVTGNEIFENRAQGVLFNNLGTISLVGNSIHDNGGLGFELANTDGIPLANDVGDADTGPNDQLNYPVLGLSSIGAGTLDINYDLDVPAGTYRVEFFDNAAPDPSGNGEGETFVASATIAHGGGSATYVTSIPGTAGDVITATATPDLGGGTYAGTSEFSNALPIGVVFVNSTADAPDASPGDGNCDTGGLNSDGYAECTLRAAIEETGANSGYDHIRFTIPETDPGFVAGAPSYWTISPATTLPFVSDTIEIDATTQPGWVDSPVIELDGSGVVSAGADGINLATGMTLRGFSVTGWLDDGAFSDQDDIVVTGNWFGISPDGAPLANQGADLVLYGASDGATIGGPLAADTNIFAAGGSEDGAILSGDTTNAVVENNRFGVAADGLTGLGTATAELLTIVDNASDILVVDNQFGDAPNAAVTLWGDPTNVTIVSNIFGTDDTGTAVLPVGQAVYAQSTGSARFGGTTSSEWNTIRNVLWQGVFLDTGHTGSFSYLGNSMTGSGLYGIDLSGDGTTPNDAGDVDSGPNDNLNVPEISSVVESGGTVRVAFGLDVPAGTYRIEAFTNPSGAHPTGFGEGEVFETSATISHAGSGQQSYELTFPGTIGALVSLTTTQDLGAGLFGATSEFSQTVQATDPALILENDRSQRRSDLAGGGGVSMSGDGAPGQAGLAVHFDGSNDRFVGPAVDITDAALTVYASFNADGLTGDPVLLSKRTSAGSPIYELSIDSGTGEVVAEVRTNSGPAVARGGSVAIGAWHQALATWDGAELVLFVDGLEVDRVALTGSLTTDVATDVIIGSTSTNSAPFDGLIDDVRVSHETTDSATVEALAQSQTTVGFVSVGGEQTSAPSPWTTSSVQTRSGSFALSAPETSGSGAAAWAVATGIDEPGLVFESWWWFSSSTGVDLSSGTRAGEAPTDQYEAALTSPSGWELRQRSGGTGSFDAPAAGSPTAGSWVNVEIRTDQFGATRLFIDGSEVTTATPQGSALLSGSMALRAGLLPTGETWYIDDARGRKLVTPEPVTSVGPLDRN